MILKQYRETRTPLTKELAKVGYPRRPTRCPRLTKEHRRRRRQWARRNRDWDLRHWRHCVFSDESRFKLYHSNVRIRVRTCEGERYIDACVQQTDGNVVPSVMVWGAFQFWGKSKLVIVEGPINQQTCRRMQNLLPWARGTFCNNVVLVQGYGPSHEARATMIFSIISIWRSWNGQPKALIGTTLSISWAKSSSIFVIWITLLPHKTIAWCSDGWSPWWGACHDGCVLFKTPMEDTHKITNVANDLSNHLTKYCMIERKFPSRLIISICYAS